MLSALLNENFDLLMDAPDSVPRMRELILQLAVMGKLVPQDKNDEPASALLKRIQAEKEKLIEEGLIKRPKELLPITDDEKPFELPDGWEWVRLGQLGWINPRNAVADQVDVGFLPMALIADGYEGTHGQEFRSWAEVKQGFTHIADGDVVMAKITPCFQNLKSVVVSGLRSGIGAGTTELYVFRPLPKNGPLPQYVLNFVKSSGFVRKGIGQMTGTAGQQRVPKQYFEQSPFPLPPLAEQKRIVEKVDRLMTLCDELEKRQRERDSVQISLNGSAFQSLTTSEDKKSFQVNLKRVRDHFGLLVSRPENVKTVRDTILQLAVMGKLVPQDKNDEPASELLKRIQAEKEKLIEEGKIKRPKELPPISEDEKPFALPDGWEWVRLGEVVTISRGHSKHRPRNDPRLFRNGTIPLVQTGEVARSNGIITETKYFYNDEGLRQSKLWPKGTLVVTIAANIGDAGILELEACFPDSVVGILPYGVTINPRYLLFFFQSVRETIEAFAPATAQKNINVAILSVLAFPLPPLAEQKRIVEKVDRMMALCDAMGEQLVSSQEDGRRLLKSVVAEMAE